MHPTCVAMTARQLLQGGERIVTSESRQVPHSHPAGLQQGQQLSLPRGCSPVFCLGALRYVYADLRPRVATLCWKCRGVGAPTASNVVPATPYSRHTMNLFSYSTSSFELAASALRTERAKARFFWVGPSWVEPRSLMFKASFEVLPRNLHTPLSVERSALLAVAYHYCWSKTCRGRE
jgi:hypothetical protein